MESDPPDGNFVVKKGKHIELRCRASGNPPPDIHWTKEVQIEREKRKLTETKITTSKESKEQTIFESTNVKLLNIELQQIT